MSIEFDPYHRWLGIPPAEQPADHYRLLGLARFEDDPEVIRDAAERQMGHVRRYGLGQHSALSQQILNELAAAKACLLDPGRKAAYDERLRLKALPAGDHRLRDEPAAPPLITGEHSVSAAGNVTPDARSDTADDLAWLETLVAPAARVSSTDAGRSRKSSSRRLAENERARRSSGPVKPSHPRRSLFEAILPQRLDAWLTSVAGPRRVVFRNLLRAVSLASPFVAVGVVVLVVLGIRSSTPKANPPSEPRPAAVAQLAKVKPEVPKPNSLSPPAEAKSEVQEPVGAKASDTTGTPTEDQARKALSENAAERTKGNSSDTSARGDDSAAKEMASSDNARKPGEKTAGTEQPKEKESASSQVAGTDQGRDEEIIEPKKSAAMPTPPSDENRERSKPESQPSPQDGGPTVRAQKHPAEICRINIPDGWRVERLSFNSNGQILAALGHGIHLFSVSTRAGLRAIPCGLQNARGIGFSPDGAMAVGGQTIKWCNTETGNVARQFEEVREFLTFSSDGRVFAEYDLPNVLIRDSLTVNFSVLYTIRVGPPGSGALSYGADGTVSLAWASSAETHLRLWKSSGPWNSPVSGGWWRTMTTNLPHVGRQMFFSPDGLQLAVRSTWEAATAESWKVWAIPQRSSLNSKPASWPTFAIPPTMTSHDSPVFRPDGQVLAACDRSGRINFWSIRDLQLWAQGGRPPPPASRGFRSAKGDMYGRGPLAFTPDGKNLVTLAEDWRSLILWDVTDLVPVAAGTRTVTWHQASTPLCSIGIAPCPRRARTPIGDERPKLARQYDTGESQS